MHVRMPKGVTKEEVNFTLTPNNISIGVLGYSAIILEGQLFENVDPEASAWILKNEKRSVIFFNQTDVSTFSGA